MYQRKILILVINRAVKMGRIEALKMRNEDIEGKELERGNTGQKEMLEDEEGKLDDEEKTRTAKETHHGKNTERERERDQKSKEHEIKGVFSKSSIPES